MIHSPQFEAVSRRVVSGLTIGIAYARACHRRRRRAPVRWQREEAIGRDLASLLAFLLWLCVEAYHAPRVPFLHKDHILCHV